MLIAGIVLLLIAVAAFFYARSERGDARKAMATETVTCADAMGLSKGVADEVGAGDFRQRCEVVGKATAVGSAAKAPESGAEAVWHRTVITHKYWVMESRTVDGRTTRSRDERQEVVSEIASAVPFSVADDSGSVLVRPEGAEVDEPEKVVDRFEPAEGVQDDDRGFFSSLLRSGADSGSLGFQHEEWIIRPGARLYVQGELSDRGGELAFAAPQDDGAFLISTRSEEEIVSDKLRTAKIATIVAAVSAVLGVGLAIAGLAS